MWLGGLFFTPIVNHAQIKRLKYWVLGIDDFEIWQWNWDFIFYYQLSFISHQPFKHRVHLTVEKVCTKISFKNSSKVHRIFYCPISCRTNNFALFRIKGGALWQQKLGHIGFASFCVPFFIFVSFCKMSPNQYWFQADRVPHQWQIPLFHNSGSPAYSSLALLSTMTLHGITF